MGNKLTIKAGISVCVYLPACGGIVLRTGNWIRLKFAMFIAQDPRMCSFAGNIVWIR